MSLPLIYNIFDWYWVVAAHNPTTQVFQSSSGTYVSNTIAAYPTWVGTSGSGALSIVGAANNGSGLIRLTTDTNNFTTNDRWVVTGVGGTTEANGTWPVTAVDSTHVDLQGSAFVHAYTSGGFIGRGTPIPSTADLGNVINTFNVSYFNQNASFINNITLTSGTPTAMTLPLAESYIITPGTSSGAELVLPPPMRPGSFPIGRPIIIKGDGTSNDKNWWLDDNNGVQLNKFGSFEGLILWLLDNTVSGGYWAFKRLVSIGIPTGDAQIIISQSDGADSGQGVYKAVSGDATLADTGALTIAKLGGAAFAPASFSPTDASGAGLTFTGVSVQTCRVGNMVYVYGRLSYPVTASGANAAITLPVAAASPNYGLVPGSAAIAGVTTMQIISNNGAATAFFINVTTAATYTNVQLSSALIVFTLVYPAA